VVNAVWMFKTPHPEPLSAILNSIVALLLLKR
jgi:hypothetical protein